MVPGDSWRFLDFSAVHGSSSTWLDGVVKSCIRLLDSDLSYVLVARCTPGPHGFSFLLHELHYLLKMCGVASSFWVQDAGEMCVCVCVRVCVCVLAREQWRVKQATDPGG